MLVRFHGPCHPGFFAMQSWSFDFFCKTKNVLGLQKRHLLCSAVLQSLEFTIHYPFKWKMFCLFGVSFTFQIRKLQEVAKELEQRMKGISDDLRQREAEAEKLRQAIRNTPPTDPAYVCTYKPCSFLIFGFTIPKMLLLNCNMKTIRLLAVPIVFC